MITVSAPALERTGGGSVSIATIRGSRFSFELRYQTSVPLERLWAEPFLLPAVLVGMAHGEPVESAAPVCPALLARIPQVQDIFATWFPTLRRVEVHAPADRPAATGAASSATFFSGGVDSFATVIRHRAELGGLLLVRGWEIGANNDAQWRVVHERSQQAADAVGIPLLAVTTNVRQLAELAGSWMTVGHGVGLAAVALLFQHLYRRIYIASSFSCADLFPWGSHPLLDPLFSTSRTVIVHDALELTRLDKLSLIAASDIALQHLRVCVRQTGSYNCGDCEKCLRTAVGLHLVHALERCGSLPYTSLPLQRLRALWIPEAHAVPFVRENLQAARNAGDAELVELLESALWRYEVRQTLSTVRQLVRTARLSTLVDFSRRAVARSFGIGKAGIP